MSSLSVILSVGKNGGVYWSKCSYGWRLVFFWVAIIITIPEFDELWNTVIDAVEESEESWIELQRSYKRDMGVD
jgi:hypothetical protein